MTLPTNDVEWLIDYYSGEKLLVIQAKVGKSIWSRLRYKRNHVPRPNGRFTPEKRAEWINRADVIAQRNKYLGMRE